jgi:hypothetical protein
MEGLAATLWRRNPIAAWEGWQKRRAFQQAHKAFRMGPRLRSAADIASLGLDAIVVGSDVVWNYGIFGYDPVFFGRVEVPRKIAYAASFGAVPRRGAHPTAMREDLARFDAIAVRDENSRAIVADSIGREVAVTVDPTLLYEFIEELAVAPQRSTNVGVVYSYRHPRAAIDAFRAWASQQGSRVVCVGYPPPLRARRAYDWIDASVGPFQWLRVMNDAQAVMTSTFHGVVFSLKYGKEFLYVTNDKSHNRVASLLAACGIPHDLRLGRQDDVVWFKPDYAEVGRRLATAADQSRAWLLAALAAAGS